MLLFLTIPLDESNKELLETIYLRYRDSMYAAALSVIHNYADAEDVIQEVFLKIAQKYMSTIRRLHKDSALLYYLLTAVKNTALNHYKKAEALYENIIDPVKLDDHLQSDIVYREQMDTYDSPLLVEKLSNLNPIYREILYQRFALNLSMKEIAETNHIRLSTVKKRLLRAKKLLRDQLEETIHE